MSKRAKNGGASNRERLLPMENIHDGGDGEHTPLFEQVQNGGGGGGGSRGGVSEPAQPHCCAVCCTFFSAVAVILLLFFSCMVQSPFVHPEGSLHWTNQARSPPPSLIARTLMCCTFLTPARDPFLVLSSLPVRGGEEPARGGCPVRGDDGHLALFLEGEAVVGRAEPVLRTQAVKDW